MEALFILIGLAMGYVIGKLATTRRMNKDMDALMVTVRRMLARPAGRTCSLRYK